MQSIETNEKTMALLSKIYEQTKKHWFHYEKRRNHRQTMVLYKKHRNQRKNNGFTAQSIGTNKKHYI